MFSNCVGFEMTKYKWAALISKGIQSKSGSSQIHVRKNILIINETFFREKASQFAQLNYGITYHRYFNAQKKNVLWKLDKLCFTIIISQRNGSFHGHLTRQESGF